MRQFDYIIAGGGASGLMLAYFMTRNDDWKPQILLIDKDQKRTNDRTWCFWEQGINRLEELVFHQWENAEFHGPDFDKVFSIQPYSYKMIRGIDFYNFMKIELEKIKNLRWINEEISSIENGVVTTNIGQYSAQTIFDSTKSLSDYSIPNKYHQLLQHFKGYVIETDKEVFNPSQFTYMDFRVDQKNDCRFGYVLPFSKTKALVEYTLFSKQLLDQAEYDEGLKDYIDTHLQIGNYRVLEEEFGVIPMTDFPFPTTNKSGVINIGTAGGHTKSSTGYTFLRTQKITQKIAANLQEGENPLRNIPFQQKRFKKYDSTLLHVLAKGHLSGAKVFTDLFRKNGPHAIFKFLDEETTITEELIIMNSTPILTFAQAFIERLHI